MQKTPVATPELVWGEEARAEMRGPNPFIFLLKPEIVRRFATQESRMLPVRRTKHLPTAGRPTGRAWYKIMWSVYPHKIPQEALPTISGERYITWVSPLIQHTYLPIDPDVAESMIRDGILHMQYPTDHYEQDLHWADDPWYVANYLGTFELQMP